MKVQIDAEEGEIEAKRHQLVKSLFGEDAKLVMKSEQVPGTVREPFFQAQADMMDHWTETWNYHMKELKKEISEVMDE